MCRGRAGRGSLAPGPGGRALWSLGARPADKGDVSGERPGEACELGGAASLEAAADLGRGALHLAPAGDAPVCTTGSASRGGKGCSRAVSPRGGRLLVGEEGGAARWGPHGWSSPGPGGGDGRRRAGDGRTPGDGWHAGLPGRQGSAAPRPPAVGRGTPIPGGGRWPPRD